MKNNPSYRRLASRTFLPLVAAALATTTVAACNTALENAEDVGFYPSESASVTSGGPGTAQSGAGGGYYGATSGTTSGGSFDDPPPTPSVEPPPEETTCAELDSSKPLVLYLSADDSNSMASPARAREALVYSNLTTGIRTYEFLNYYNLHYPLPPSGEVVVFPELAPSDAETGYDLQIGVQSGPAPLERRPLTITLVLDTSGSMQGLAIERERMVVRAIAENLVAGDIVNAVEWSSDQTAMLSGHVVTGPNDPALVNLANTLKAKGGTDLHGGLSAGYELATKHYGENRLNRVILISDGGANMGITSAELIAKHSEDADKEGIYLVGVGTGSSHAGYNDSLMDAVTDEGRGAYVYIDSEAEAKRMFGERFNEVMEVAARGVQVELTLPWYFQMHRFHGEEYSTDPKEVKPQHLAPADAMVLFQTLKPCSQEVVNDQDSITVTATWEDSTTRAKRQFSVSKTIAQLLSAQPLQMDKGRAIVAYAEALKTTDPDKVKAALSKVKAANSEGTDADLNAIEELLKKHPAN